MGISARAWRITGILVAILLVLLIGLDRGGVYFAEYETGKTLQDSQHLDGRPAVDISGFPFLTQVIAGEFDRVTVDAKGVLVHPRGMDLRVAKMHVVLHDVSTSRSFSSFTVGTADADALITYADLGETVHAELDYDGSGRVKGSESAVGLTASVSAKPTLVGQSLHLDDLHITLPGGVPVPSSVVQAFPVDLPLTDIPFGLSAQSLTARPDGIHIRLTGQNISYKQ